MGQMLANISGVEQRKFFNKDNKKILIQIFISIMLILSIDTILIILGGTYQGILIITIILLLLGIDGIFLSCMKSKELPIKFSLYDGHMVINRKGEIDTDSNFFYTIFYNEISEIIYNESSQLLTILGNLHIKYIINNKETEADASECHFVISKEMLCQLKKPIENTVGIKIIKKTYDVQKYKNTIIKQEG